MNAWMNEWMNEWGFRFFGFVHIHVVGETRKPSEDGEMNEMPSRHRIWNSSPGGLMLPTILNIYEWAGNKHFVSLKLECQRGGGGGGEPVISDFPSRQPLATAPGPPSNIRRVLWNTYRDKLVTQQTRGIHPMLFHCWVSVGDGVPTLKQLWVNAPCLLGSHRSRLNFFYDTAATHLNSYAEHLICITW